MQRSASGQRVGSRPASAERRLASGSNALQTSARPRALAADAASAVGSEVADDAASDVTHQTSEAYTPAAKIRVICRLRPMSEQERKTGTIPAVTASSERQEVVACKAIGDRQSRQSFHFDHVLSSFSTQRDVFAVTLKPLVRDVLAGYEAAIFAYGQTGTGKTYTMEGDLDSSERRGLVPRAAEALIRSLGQGDYRDYQVLASCLEIYNEELIDLLATQPEKDRPKMDVKETGRGVCCVGLSETPVSSVEEIQALIRRAQERRRVAETRLNARSSRSHCLFTFKVTCRQRVEGGEIEAMGKLHLVDLAGSECARNCGGYATELARVEGERERRNINQSLLTLGRVIAALRDANSRVPYRDSKLTRMLQEALGGGCRTVMIATISPAQCVIDETISTLQYAEQATGIQNKLQSSASMFRPAGNVSPVLDGRCTGFGDMEPRVEINELEMRLEYLNQEVEEAHAAFQQKQREAQELHAQNDAKDAAVKKLSDQLEDATRKFDEKSFMLEKTTAFADERDGDVEKLAEALSSTWQRCSDLASRVKEQKAQVRGVCSSGEKHSSACVEVARVASQEAAESVEKARRTHRDGIETMVGLAGEQGQTIAQLVEMVNLNGGRLLQELVDIVTKLGAEVPVKDKQEAAKAALVALQQLVKAHVDEVEEHSRAANDAKTRTLEDSSAATTRRSLMRESMEQLITSHSSSAADHVEPLRTALQSLDHDLAESGGALDASMSVMASQLSTAKADLASTAASGRVREAISKADATLTASWAQVGKHIVGVRELLASSEEKLRAEATTDAFAQRMTQATTSAAKKSARELAALADERKALVADVSALRQQATVERQVVAQLSEQREVLDKDVKSMQSSLQRISEDVTSAKAEMVTQEEEQRVLRNTAMRAIMKGVEDLVKGELQNLDDGLQAGVSQMNGKLDQIATLTSETCTSLTASERHAVEASTRAATMVSTWSAETSSLCDNIQTTEEKLASSAQHLQTCIDDVVAQVNSVAEDLRPYGVRVNEALDGVKGMFNDVETTQDSTVPMWAAARQAAADATDEWSSSLATVDNSLETIVAKHSDITQQTVALRKQVTGHSTDAKAVVQVLSTDEEHHSTALAKLSALHTRHSDEDTATEGARGDASTALAQGAANTATTARKHAEQFKQTWQTVCDCNEAVTSAAASSVAATRHHEAAIGSARDVISEADHAYRKSSAAMDASSAQVSNLAQLTTIWHDAVANEPMAAFDDKEPELAADAADAPPKLVTALRCRQRPSEADMSAEWRSRRPSANYGRSKSGSLETINGLSPAALAAAAADSATKENEPLCIAKPGKKVAAMVNAMGQQRAPGALKEVQTVAAVGRAQ